MSWRYGYEIAGDDDTVTVYPVGTGRFSSWSVDDGNGNERSAGLTREAALSRGLRLAGDNAKTRTVRIGDDEESQAEWIHEPPEPDDDDDEEPST